MSQLRSKKVVKCALRSWLKSCNFLTLKTVARKVQRVASLTQLVLCGRYKLYMNFILENKNNLQRHLLEIAAGDIC